MTLGRTSREASPTSSAVPTESAAENQNTPDSDQPRPSTRITPPRIGPTANPTGPDAPKIAIVVPSRRSGTTSRMPASITPVLPSWNPISSRLRASCHGSWDSATQAKTTASTRQLRTMTALREYLSAQTPQSGTSGAPTTKISAVNRPTNERRSALGTPISVRSDGRNAKTWLTPSPSTIDVNQNTATMTRQSSRPRGSWMDGTAGPGTATVSTAGASCDDISTNRR